MLGLPASDLRKSFLHVLSLAFLFCMGCLWSFDKRHGGLYEGKDQMHSPWHVACWKRRYIGMLILATRNHGMGRQGTVGSGVGKGRVV